MGMLPALPWVGSNFRHSNSRWIVLASDDVIKAAGYKLELVTLSCPLS
jgi:hypothetical protein